MVNQCKITYCHRFHFLFPVPCGPSVTVDLDCKSQALTLDWVTSSRAQGYISVLSSNNSQMTYNTTESELRISQLECGLDYSVKVMSYYGACLSLPSVLPVRQSKRTTWEMLFAFWNY